jgi:hypothetical protein
MTVRMTKPQATLRELLAGLKKRTGLFGEQIIRAETAADFYNVIGQNRNRFINGDMRIDQRNAGGSIAISNELFAVDRTMIESGGQNSNTGTVQQVTDGPPGFNKSLKYTAGSSNYNAIGFCAFNQRIEGQNVQDFAFGTAYAQPITLSFWVKSSIPGTYTNNITTYNGTNERWNNQTYTINTANTWEYKTLTFVGDNLYGPSNNTTGFMRVYWHLGGDAGSATTTSFNTWFNGTGSKRAATTQTNLLGTSGATFFLTGIQLEKGAVATPFEHRSLGTELALCQRYFQIVGGTGGTEHFANGVTTTDRINIVYNFKQTMRAAPSFTATGFGSAFGNLSIYNGITTVIVTGTNENYMSANSASIGFTHGGSTSAGGAGYIYFNSAAARVAFSAEL